jgi:hypothetical protein
MHPAGKPAFRSHFRAVGKNRKSSDRLYPASFSRSPFSLSRLEIVSRVRANTVHQHHVGRFESGLSPGQDFSEISMCACFADCET